MAQSTTEVFRLLNPNALLSAEFVAFMREATASGARFFAGGDFDKAALEFFTAIGNPLMGIFIGVEDGRYKAFGMISLPTDKLLPYPLILHAFNKGSKKLGKSMLAQGLQFVKENGYTQTLAVNGSDREDALWEGAISRAGGEFKRIGAMVLIGVPK
jgi:hypothetical protein